MSVADAKVSQQHRTVYIKVSADSPVHVSNLWDLECAACCTFVTSSKAVAVHLSCLQVQKTECQHVC